MSQLRSQLSKFQASTMDVEEVKRNGWIEEGILVIQSADPRLHWTEQETIQRIGNKLYGERCRYLGKAFGVRTCSFDNREEVNCKTCTDRNRERGN